MKQSAAKTLGVAALGAAFAAAGAGVASAAPAALPDTSQALETVARTLPAENLNQAVPGSAEALHQGQTALGAGLRAAQPAAESVLAEGPTGPAATLLGGMPVQGVPAHGTGVNGLPLA
ncbi:ATP-binding protein [Streptomyces spinoverrucosus]|uniref:ATP-binding protein n=1 Tax=Streptomyces spinoverrucosus TaxID=284043 RepID=UPI0018C3DB15|nr:ATP-binding protein [Streptomyces spinoverrucosus]MBG0852956.1 ATP-binding protein [Streptomyces spinoverrucosus]